MFILTDAAIEAIKNSLELRNNLSTALKTSASSIYRFYTENEPNNDLTKYAALVVIRKETGWKDEKILKEVSKGRVVVTAK
jgi:hypothetical protein